MTANKGRAVEMVGDITDQRKIETLEDALDVLDEVFERAKFEPFGLAQGVYDLAKLVDEADGASVFQRACEQYGVVDSCEAWTLAPSAHVGERENLIYKYGDIVDAFIEAFQKQGLSERDYYVKLWETYTNQGLFPDEASVVFAIYYTLVDSRIPYFHFSEAELYQMGNEEFKTLIAQDRTLQQKVRFIQRSEFSQKTERASAFLSVLGIKKPGPKASSQAIEQYQSQILAVVYLLKEEEASLAQALRHVRG